MTNSKFFSKRRESENLLREIRESPEIDGSTIEDLKNLLATNDKKTSENAIRAIASIASIKPKKVSEKMAGLDLFSFEDSNEYQRDVVKIYTFVSEQHPEYIYVGKNMGFQSNYSSWEDGSPSAKENKKIMINPEDICSIYEEGDKDIKENVMRLTYNLSVESPGRAKEILSEFDDLTEVDSVGYKLNSSRLVHNVSKCCPSDVKQFISHLILTSNSENRIVRKNSILALGNIVRKSPEELDKVLKEYLGGLGSFVSDLTDFLGDKSDREEVLRALSCVMSENPEYIEKSIEEYPDNLEEFTSDLLSLPLSEEKVVRENVLRSLSRIAEKNPNTVKSSFSDLTDFLGDKSDREEVLRALSCVMSENPEYIEKSIEEYPDNLEEFTSNIYSLLDDDRKAIRKNSVFVLHNILTERDVNIEEIMDRSMVKKLMDFRKDEESPEIRKMARELVREAEQEGLRVITDQIVSNVYDYIVENEGEVDVEKAPLELNISSETFRKAVRELEEEGELERVE